jgi:hypothetical protein
VLNKEGDEAGEILNRSNSLNDSELGLVIGEFRIEGNKEGNEA